MALETGEKLPISSTPIKQEKMWKNITNNFTSSPTYQFPIIQGAPILSKRDKEGKLVRLGERLNSNKKGKKSVSRQVNNQNHQFRTKINNNIRKRIFNSESPSERGTEEWG